jgi:toxin ParE1/3/4
LNWLAGSGTSGVSRENLRPGLRALVYKNRIIYFRVTQDECRIVRVLHSRQDISTQSFSDDDAGA